MILVRTPLRISLAGGGSDLPAFYKKFPGAVLSFTIDKYVYIAVKPHFDPDRVRVSYSVTENVLNAGAVEHELVRHAMLHTGIFSGIEIVSVADVPGAGSGLGSSSSYLVGLLHALWTFKGESASPQKLAEQAFHLEAENLGKPIGKQDHYAAAFGDLNLIRFLSEKVEVLSVKSRLPIISFAGFREELAARLLLFWTGITRSSDIVLSAQRYNTSASKRTRGNLEEMVQLALEMDGTLMQKDFDYVGELLHENWMLKRKLADAISNEQIDEWYEAGRQAGALGGKICGAGGGGFLLFMSKEGKQEAIRERMKELGLRELPFKITMEGSAVVYQD